MRRLIVSVLLLLVGFAVGLGYALVALPEPLAGAPIADPMLLSMRQSLVRIEAGLPKQPASLPRADAGRAQPRGSAVPSAHHAGPLPGAGSDGPGGETPSQPRRAFPETRAARLAALDGWSRDEAMRSKWLGANGRELSAWFGPADEMADGRGGAWWTYRASGGGGGAAEYAFLVGTAGRVLDFRSPGTAR